MSSYGHAFSVTGGTSKKERFDGEMLAGKGVLSVRVMTPSGPVLVVNTHVRRGRLREREEGRERWRELMMGKTIYTLNTS